MKTNITNSLALAALVALAVAPLQAQGTQPNVFHPDQVHAGYVNGQPGPNGSGKVTKEFLLHQKAASQEADQLDREGNALLAEGQFAAAEADFREELEVEPGSPLPYAGLAAALEGQGRTGEAIVAYRTLIFQYGSPDSKVVVNTENFTGMRMGYAISLSKAGQWPEAVAVYEKALPTIGSGGQGTPKVDVHFDPRVPMPAQLQAMAHIAIGSDAGEYDHNIAFNEFSKALALAPDSPLANYYYGDGWRQLAPKSRARVAYAQQARAAFQKAAKLGEGDVKKNAEEALKALAPPR